MITGERDYGCRGNRPRHYIHVVQSVRCDLVQSGESPSLPVGSPSWRPAVVQADNSDAEVLSEEFSECSDDETALEGN